MKTLVPFFMTILLLSCTKSTDIQNGGTQTDNGLLNDTQPSMASVEGTVGYFLPEVAVGGELDPAGFVLANPHWYAGQPTYSFYRIYLQGSVDSSDLGMFIRIEGIPDTLIVSSLERGRRYFPLLTVAETSPQ